MAKESLIPYSLPNQGTIFIPASRFFKMSDNDFKDLDTGNHTFPRIAEDIVDIYLNVDFGELDKIEEIEDYDPSDDDIIFYPEE